MLAVYELPQEFRDIRKLERVLIANRFLFTKISILSKCFSKYSMLNEFISKAPGENVMTETLTYDIICEELRHPHCISYCNIWVSTKEKSATHTNYIF